MNKKQKIIVSVVGITIVLLTLLGLTYAYFLTRIQGNTNDKSISVTTADLKLVYGDGSDGVIGGENLIPSDTIYTKTFTVKNEGNANVEYGVYLIDVINTLVRKDDVKCTLNCTTDGTITCNKVTTETTFPSGIKQLVTNEIEPGKTHTYTFTFTYKDTNTDQSIDMGKELSAKIQIFGKQPNGEFFPFEDGSLASAIINNAKTSINGTTFVDNLSSTNLSSKWTTYDEKMLATAEDDYGTSYYFRGNPTDNYLNYASMCWRIIRIQGDGSVKLLLASEKTCSTTNLTDDSGLATDGAAGTQGTKIKTEYGKKSIKDGFYLLDYINGNKEGQARYDLNLWLNRKITNENDKLLLKNETWCIGDQKNGYEYWYNTSGNIIGTIDDLINSNTDFYYVAAKKLSTNTPSYKCDITGTTGETDINKIGLITLDEVMYAGGTFGSANEGESDNNNSYILDNGQSDYTVGDCNLTLTPYALNIIETPVGYYSNPFPIFITSGGVANDASTDNGGIRPVLSIKGGIKITSGDGTIEKPYEIAS
mgnify:FL=1